MKKAIWIITLSIFLVIPVLAQAAVIYDNFGPPPGYKTSGPVGFAVGPIDPFADNVVSASFVPSTTSFLTSFDVPIWNIAGSEGTTMQFSLTEDSASGPSKNVLETYSLPLGPSGSFNTYTVNSSIMPVLNASENYWLVASSPDKVAWLYTTSNDTTDFAYTWKREFVDWQVDTSDMGRQLGIIVEGRPVPIPTSIVLLCSGMGCLVALRRKYERS